MDMNAPVPSRRRFLIQAALATASLPIAIGLLSDAEAAGLPRLPVDNPQAKALGYVENATTTRHPNYKPGSDCANCRFFTASNEACSIFPGFSVEPKGWCSVWAKQPS